MRVTESLNQTQFLAALDTLESNISLTNNQMSTGLQFSTPSQDPVAAGNVNTYNQVLAQSQQYTSNANSAQTSLTTENSTLSQLQTQLQSLRSLALEANSGTATGADLTAIAAQATQIQSGLVGLANTQDGNGNYIFSGFSTQTQPFTLTSTGASYSGDQGQPQVQIAAGQTVAAGDNGDTVFNQIKTGNGTFAAAAAAGNSGSGVVGATTVASPNAPTGAPFKIAFTAANTYQVTDATNDVVAGGAYTAGQTIAFSGLNVPLTGQPASGDSFAVAPAANGVVGVTPTAGNTGSGAPGVASYAGSVYNIAFTSATTYQVQKQTSTGVLVESAGTYAPGQPITVGDEKVTLNGAPKSGDSFAVDPSTNANYTVAPASSNTGTGYTAPIGYSGGAYTIKFLTPSTYQVLDAGGTAVSSGAYTAGQAISFAGAQVTLTGTPAAGDTFGVTPSANQSLFTTVQNLVNAIQSGAGSANKAQLNNAISSGLNDLDQAISQTSTVQANVGGRMNAITTQLSVQSSQQIQLKASISSLQGLDYAAAITSLDQQNTTLSAAMQAYTLTQGLSLFKYIS
jgi:flagellar hook-associated protein 3 FlgL